MPDRFQLFLLLAPLLHAACATAEDPAGSDTWTPADRGADRVDAPAEADAPADADATDAADRADGPDAADDAPEADSTLEADSPAEGEADAAADADAPPGPCAGHVVEGACWYLSAEERSCDDACSSHGGYAEATRTFAGSSGTNANCDAVLDALGVAGSRTSTLAVSGAAVGCFYMNLADARYRVQDMTTSSSATYTWARRACACNE